MSPNHDAEADLAFDRLVEEHRRDVGLFLVRLVHDRELAEAGAGAARSSGSC